MASGLGIDIGSEGRDSMTQMTTDHLPTEKRVEIWTKEERHLREELAKTHPIIPIEDEADDTIRKTDGYWVEDGTKKRIAIKCRESIFLDKKFNDILVCLYQPWNGPNMPGTNKGRDMVVEYYKYIVLSGFKDEAWICDGARIHEICMDMLEEARECRWDFPMKSKKHPGCQIRLHHDKKSGVPKLLAFIPPDYLVGDEIERLPVSGFELPTNEISVVSAASLLDEILDLTYKGWYDVWILDSDPPELEVMYDKEKPEGYDFWCGYEVHFVKTSVPVP